MPGKQALSGSRHEVGVALVQATKMEAERLKKAAVLLCSGKKKQYTLKVQVVVAKKTKRILCIHHDKGKTHDFKVFTKSKLPLDKKIKLKADNGCQEAQHVLSWQ